LTHFIHSSESLHPHLLVMTHNDEDASFLHSIPNGVLEEFRAEACLRILITTFDSFLPTHWQMYSGSFIKKNPMMFVDTKWVKIEILKEFLCEREVSDSRKNSILFFLLVVNYYYNDAFTGICTRQTHYQRVNQKRTRTRGQCMHEKTLLSLLSLLEN
jgi:hypothetical protein